MGVILPGVDGTGFSPSFFVGLGREEINFCESVMGEVWEFTPVSPSTLVFSSTLVPCFALVSSSILAPCSALVFSSTLVPCFTFVSSSTGFSLVFSSTGSALVFSSSLVSSSTGSALVFSFALVSSSTLLSSSTGSALVFSSAPVSSSALIFLKSPWVPILPVPSWPPAIPWFPGPFAIGLALRLFHRTSPGLLFWVYFVWSGASGICSLGSM